jgi:hypothetical protein
VHLLSGRKEHLFLQRRKVPNSCSPLLTSSHFSSIVVHLHTKGLYFTLQLFSVAFLWPLLSHMWTQLAFLHPFRNPRGAWLPTKSFLCFI